MRARNKRFILQANQVSVDCATGGWDAHGVSISNPTAQYLFVPAVNDWIAPQSRGTFSLGGDPVLTVQWGAPPGIAQPAAITTPVPQQASIVLTDDSLPNAGGPITLTTSVTILSASCKVFNTLSEGIPNGAQTALTFDSERFDTDNMHTPGVPDRITFNTGGVYFVAGNIVFTANAVGAQRFLGILLNGTNYIAISRMTPNGAGVNHELFAGTIWQFTAGDFIQLIALHDSGGVLNVLASPNFSLEFGAVKVT